MDEDEHIGDVNTPSPTDDWLDVNVFDNALDYLEKAATFLSNGEDSFRWKWVTITLTNALYGFMICALSPNDEFPVIDWNGSEEDKRKKAAIDTLGKIGSTDALSKRDRIIIEHLRSPKTKLIRFDEALKRVRDSKWMGKPDSGIDKPIELSNKQGESIRELRKRFRNYFEHCIGPHWSIHGSEFVKHFHDTNDAIRKVLTDIRMSWGRKEKCERAEVLLETIDRLLNKIEHQLKSS